MSNYADKGNVELLLNAPADLFQNGVCWHQRLFGQVSTQTVRYQLPII